MLPLVLLGPIVTNKGNVWFLSLSVIVSSVDLFEMEIVATNRR